MASSCSYIPRNKKGEELKGFQTYRKELGYKVGSKVFTQVLSPSFQKDYEKTLSLDEQGVPTYESAIKTPHIKNFIGTAKLQEVDQKQFPYVENTRDNYGRLVMSAHNYNINSDNKDTLTAVVSLSEDGKSIRVELKERNENSIEEYKSQYSTYMLNEKIREILLDLNIDITLLENNETNVDGYVDFSKAINIADGFIGLINIANGMKGEMALSEEFSHVLVGILKDHPLVKRSLNQLVANDEIVREVLGEEYDANYDYYSEHPNYDEEGNEMSVEESMAEEALGKILSDRLHAAEEGEEKPSRPLNNLISRLIAAIKKIFKGRSANDIKKAKNDVIADMGELAKNVLQGTEPLSNEQLMKNRRNARFNLLRESTDKVLDTLRNAVEIERKRFKISREDEDKKEAKNRVTLLEAALTDKDKLIGVHTYAKYALADLQQVVKDIDFSGTLETANFTLLRKIKSVLDSYSGFIDDFHEALDELGDDNTTITIDNNVEVNLRELWKEIDDVYKSCIDKFTETAITSFCDFLAPIYNKCPIRDEKGNVRPIRDVLIGKDFDISELDRWITSMGNSSSIVLQLFDKVVKNAQDKIKTRTEKSMRQIWKIRQKAESMGITDFEFIHEKFPDGSRTGNYISRKNYGQFRKDRKEFEEHLREKYGKHPVGEDFTKFIEERKAWYAEHAEMDEFGNIHAGDMYLNPEYNKLSAGQKEILKDILAYKDSIEEAYPPNKRNHLRAIQRRRSGTQRLSDMLNNPSKAVSSVIADVKAAFNRSEDDDLLYGNDEDWTRGLTDFSGKEYFTLPILYTSRLKDPNTLSNDIFSDLMVYAHAANTYSEMSKIYDPLEIGVTVVEGKDLIKNAGSKVKEEVLNTLGRVTKKTIKIGSNTSFAKKLMDYLECQVYGRHMKEDDVFGRAGQKRIGFFQKLTSTAYLGCNYLAGIANVATARGMQHIEAAAHEWFSFKDLAAADAIYGKHLPEFLAELGSRSKQSWLGLFDELFDVRQNFKDRIKNTQMKSIYRRFFGKNWLFVQQGMGDHWIYNSTAIAMCRKKKVKLADGRVVKLLDALEIVTDETGFKKMQIKPGTRDINEKGEVGDILDAKAFGRAIAHINHSIAGIYNDEDQNAANRIILGRALQQMRKWIWPQMMRRFQSKRPNLDLGREEEGYYRTAAGLIKDIWKSGFKIAAEWDKLDNTQKANCRRAFFEIAQTYALWVIINLVGSGVKDPDRGWAAQFTEYMLNRELHELGFLTPGHMMLTEGYKTVTSPMVMLSAANKCAQAMTVAMWPGNWFPNDDELIKSGQYKGHSHLYKRFMELPLPPFTQFRQIDKFIDDLDTGTKYYSRDYK